MSNLPDLPVPPPNLGPPPPASDAFSLVDRQYVGQFSTFAAGLTVRSGGMPANADGEVLATLTDTSLNTVTFTNQVATTTETGVYVCTLQSTDTQVPDPYTLSWSWTMGGIPQVYQSYLVVGPSSPAYDNLDPGLQDMVQWVWLRMIDAYDSTIGGANLQMWFQSRFSVGRVAQLMRIALNRINASMQPSSGYVLDPGSDQFPYADASAAAVLEQATWVETIKHLQRSYVEQPVYDGATVARLDRRDYMDRWGVVLQQEEALFKQELDVFKINRMGLSTTRVLAAGGLYPQFWRAMPGLSAARGYMWNRWM
jgi:hypothetical protein